MSDQLSQDLASLRIDRSAAPPRSRAPLVALAVLIVAAAGGVYAYRSLARAIFKTEVATTEVTVVSPAQALAELSGVGYVVAQRQSKVACQILGRIAEMRVVEGSRVKAGDVLFRLEDAGQRAALAAARARAASSRARVEAAGALLGELDQRLRRDERLIKDRAIDQASIDDLGEQVRAQRGTLAAAKAEAAAVEEEVRAAEVQLDYTVVRAPFAGAVRGKPLDVGEMLGTFNEKPAVELFDPETLRAEIDVPEKRMAKVRPGGPAEVVLEAYPEDRFRAVVEEIGSQVDRSKGTVVAKLRLIDRPERFLPDMRARASFLAEALDAAAAKAPAKVVLPRAAVAERSGAKVVFRVEEGHVHMMPIVLGAPFGAGFELVVGPAPGTVVVADPPDTLADGQPVKERSR